MEDNAIERMRDYEWPEMHLCLCLECSKLYKSWRESERSYSYKEFITNLNSANRNQEEPIEVQIADRYIHFTATHLVEVQAILERHKRIRHQEQED